MYGWAAPGIDRRARNTGARRAAAGVRTGGRATSPAVSLMKKRTTIRRARAHLMERSVYTTITRTRRVGTVIARARELQAREALMRRLIPSHTGSSTISCRQTHTKVVTAAAHIAEYTSSALLGRSTAAAGTAHPQV